uniref:Uncharacterized protein n=1 Tax=Siphoviridae sp. ct0Wl9 TaxID=2827763 RepID=A0A8S5T8K3_9CAUD|nr:MAG TPA: hypothetical protein [Siphoviridae sp. ct0Wl9]
MLVKIQLKYRKDGDPGQGHCGTAISRSKSEKILLCKLNIGN